MRVLPLVRPFALGVIDGWRQPWDLKNGRTFPDAPDVSAYYANDAYDRGANVGQAVRQCLQVVRSLGDIKP